MIVSPLSSYVTIAKSPQASTPAMMNEVSVFTFIQGFTGEDILSYEELIAANITNIFVYDIPEDKKEFNIETVRKCINDIELQPYEWKHVYILRHFDTANSYAQNALLKVLEECPLYAIIILEVENPNSVFETVRSRIINLTSASFGDIMPIWGDIIIKSYIKKQHKELVEALHNLKCTSNEAIMILRWVYSYLEYEDMEKCTQAIEILASTHENPKYILDVFFL